MVAGRSMILDKVQVVQIFRQSRAMLDIVGYCLNIRGISVHKSRNLAGIFLDKPVTPPHLARPKHVGITRLVSLSP